MYKAWECCFVIIGGQMNVMHYFRIQLTHFCEKLINSGVSPEDFKVIGGGPGSNIHVDFIRKIFVLRNQCFLRNWKIPTHFRVMVIWISGIWPFLGKKWPKICQFWVITFEIIVLNGQNFPKTHIPISCSNFWLINQLS